MNALILSEPLKAFKASELFFGLPFENKFCRALFCRKDQKVMAVVAGFRRCVDAYKERVGQFLPQNKGVTSAAQRSEKSAVCFKPVELGGNGAGFDAQTNIVIAHTIDVDRGNSMFEDSPSRVNTEIPNFSKQFCTCFCHVAPSDSADFHSLLLSMSEIDLTPLFSHRPEKAPSYLAKVKTMTTKENLLALANAVGGLMFLAVLVTVCLAMAAAPVALFIWLVLLMLKFLGVFA